MAKTKTRRDPLPLAGAVIKLQWAYMAAECLMVLATLIEVRTLRALPSDQPATLTGELPLSMAENIIIGLGGILGFIVYFIAAFATLKWIYRVNMNAGLLAPSKQVSAGWSIGWYFVPIASLIMPFKAMRETWQISQSPRGWRAVATPGPLRLWWGLFVMVSITGNIGTRYGFSAKTVEDLLIGDYFVLLSSIIAIPLAYVLTRIVRDLSEMQSATLSIDVFADRPAPLVVTG